MKIINPHCIADDQFIQDRGTCRMKKNLKIAKRYAKALMLLALENDQLAGIRKNLSLISKLICGSELESALLNPIYHTQERRNLLKAVLDKLEPEDMLYRFLIFLFDQERLYELEQIDEVFQRMADAKEGLVRAEVSAAVAVPDEVTKKIADAVMRYSGRKVIIEVKEDPEIIGGLIARLGDYVYDGSVRTQVRNLREALKHSDDV